MKHLFFSAGIFFVAVFFGCAPSLNIPSKEESTKKIATIKPCLDSLIESINLQTRSLPTGTDLISRTRLSAINTLLTRVSNRSLADIHIDFLSTQPLWKEDKSVLGISYTNYINIDTGKMDVDLKKFQFNDFSGNLVNAEFEIEGTGKISVSGKYTGVTAGATPQIHFYLNERVQFVLTTADSDAIRLKPVPQTVMLKTKATITLGRWSIPFYKEIPLELTDLIKPVFIPSALRSEIIFPLPAAQYGEQRLEFVKRYLRFTKSTVHANENVLEYRSNIDFEKE